MPATWSTRRLVVMRVIGLDLSTLRREPSLMSTRRNHAYELARDVMLLKTELLG